MLFRSSSDVLPSAAVLELSPVSTVTTLPVAIAAKRARQVATAASRERMRDAGKAPGKGRMSAYIKAASAVRKEFSLRGLHFLPSAT